MIYAIGYVVIGIIVGSGVYAYEQKQNVYYPDPTLGMFALVTWPLALIVIAVMCLAEVWKKVL